MGGKKRRLTAGGEQDVVARGGDAGAVLDPRRHRIAQARHAWHQGIPGVPATRRGVHRIQYRRIGADIVLADGQLGDRFTRRDHRARPVKQPPAIVAALIEVGQPF